ncbi:MAG: isochorismate synthase [Phormidium sp.]
MQTFLSMPVTQHHANLIQDCQELNQFLSACKQTLSEKRPSKIVSISWEAKSIDPLAVLDKICPADEIHFYGEKTKKAEAIAAFGTVVKFKVAGTHRFSQVQQFIESCLSNTTAIGALNLPFSGPHFFCSFTFFDEDNYSDPSFPSAMVFLPQWQISAQKNRCIIVNNILIDKNFNIEKTCATIWEKYQGIKLTKTLNFSHVHEYKLAWQTKDVTDKSNFYSSVLSALELIKQEQISKIVLAHAIDVKAPRPFNLICSLHNLRQKYPDCHVFSLSNGKGKNFIGASPERLIKTQNQELETDALAGSAPRGKTLVEDAYFAEKLLTSQKDRTEHQIVSDFIFQRLSNLGLTPHKLPIPSLLKLSNIQHLWTPIRGKIPLAIHPLEILAELHPTPAVAGVPRDIALKQIRRYEKFNRSVYAAPIGWIDHQGNSEFIVGIRSALIESDRARLWAGAGIVAGSDPEKELAEIQLKLQALLKALI